MYVQALFFNKFNIELIFIQHRKTHRIILQVIPVEKFQLLCGMKITEAIAEKINFLLYKPSSQFLPVRIIYTNSSASPIFRFLIGILRAVSTDLRLAVGKSEDEVGDVVLPSFFMLTLSTWKDFFWILKMTLREKVVINYCVKAFCY